MNEFFEPKDFENDGLSSKSEAIWLAERANRLLKERGINVYSNDNSLGWFKLAYGNDPPTMQALIINIRPVDPPDTAEGLLRKLCEIGAASYASDEVRALLKRADEWLEKHGK